LRFAAALRETCLVEPSPEIRRIVERWLNASREGDADAVLERLSDQSGTLAIGTDATEWWHSQELSVWRRQIEDLGGIPLAWDEIEAWEEGTVGWASVRGIIEVPEQTFEVRGTHVLHLERGEWKLVNVHWSVPKSNEDVWGVTLPVSLEQLEQTIQRERPDLSSNLAADGTVTIVFTDIVDSTVLTARLGATHGSKSFGGTTT